jgi:hypothetical protein
MTPKEKAEQLLESMAFSCRECDYEAKAKQSALIAVDAISKIVNLEFPGNCETVDIFLYWQKVKREIEKL